MCSLAQWSQVGVVSHWHRQAHGCKHGIFLSLLQLALLLLQTGSLGFLRFGIAFRIPAKVAILLPAPNRCHERMTQVVLALCIVLDILPFELGASATIKHQ